MKLLDYVEHRPWPLPPGRWAMTQTWHNLLFAHWPVSPDALRPIVPSKLEIDTFGGSAWLGIIPFRLSAIRLNGFPEVPLVARFPEINVRTYVSAGGKPGVFFLSLDTDNLFTVAVGKQWFRLPYFRSRIIFLERGGAIRFVNRRTERNAPQANFSAIYRPCSPAFTAQPGTLEHWLTERYCYYALNRRQDLYRCDIHHPPWRLQRAWATIRENTMALSHGVELPQIEPFLLYAHWMKALIWSIKGEL